MQSLTLYELNNLVQQVLKLQLDDSYWVDAEVSEARLASNGHFYLELTQSDAFGSGMVAKARATMWRATYARLMPKFEDVTGERVRAGMKVRLQVTVEFHELYGYSLNVIGIDPSFTLGDMAQRRREILAKLEADGILEDNQQLPLPTLLKRIAVISSATAAGYGDFCKQLQQNAAGLAFTLKLFPAVMQGQHVEESVMSALEAVCTDTAQWDCVVIIRGGGATSDLSDFDSYPLAAAVAQMPLPVIVGIGHERDVTVLDFVAHTSMKTPTAVAAFILDHQTQLLSHLDSIATAVQRGAREALLRHHNRFELLARTLPQRFALRVEREQMRLERLSQAMPHNWQMRCERERNKLEHTEQLMNRAAFRLWQQADMQLRLIEQRCKSLDPQALLERGFSLTYHNGKLLRDSSTLQDGDELTTRLASGLVTSVVKKR
ncbi:MAG: exodeoxyribonuclease VII large subunit [Bacteroidaceae bacterium]|nr:exodeoxyribonuclease VII large subunit [Bacteroidaceae bacterium]